VGSPGKGNWAHVPWVSVFDPVVTTSATRGYYVVYLVSADCRRIYLSLNQGTTAIREEFGARYTDELRRRAQLMRQRVPDYDGRFNDAPIDLASTASLPAGYEAGHAFGLRYDAGAVPDDETLAQDLRAIVRMYLQLTARRGLEPSADPEEFGDEFQGGTVTETRRYRLHRRIERDSSAGRKAKQVHGYTCQACGFDFEAVYGELGRSFIEAHHLTPLADLPEDEPAPQDPQKDFAVLCANCHRMIHKTDAPGDLERLRDCGRLASFRELLRRLYASA
jgi:5-methylcytosine-specific restriction protein A